MARLSRIVFHLFIFYVEKSLYLALQVKKHIGGVKRCLPQAKKRVILWDENTEEETEIRKKNRK
jgi:hypothetical protein